MVIEQIHSLPPRHGIEALLETRFQASEYVVLLVTILGTSMQNVNTVISAALPVLALFLLPSSSKAIPVRDSFDVRATGVEVFENTGNDRHFGVDASLDALSLLRELITMDISRALLWSHNAGFDTEHTVTSSSSHDNPVFATDLYLRGVAGFHGQ